MPSIWRIVGIAVSKVRYLKRELAHAGGAQIGLLDRIDNRADRAEPAARFGHLDFSRLWQHDHFALRAEQRLHFGGSLFGRHVPHGKQYADEFVLAARIEFGQRHIGHQVGRDAIFQVDDDQHPLAADECITFRQQHAVEHIECFGRCVAAGIGVIKSAGRRRLHQQREAGLLGEPIQYILPGLVAEAEREAPVGSGRSGLCRCDRSGWGGRCGGRWASIALVITLAGALSAFAGLGLSPISAFAAVTKTRIAPTPLRTDVSRTHERKVRRTIDIGTGSDEIRTARRGGQGRGGTK